VLVNLFLWKHIVRGIDAATMRVTYVSIDALYIIAKFPANDPLVMLQRMAENRTKISTILTHTMNHMNLVLGKPSQSQGQIPKVPGSSWVPVATTTLVVPHSTCPSLSPSPPRTHLYNRS
jgi:hypothetical protein